MEFSLHINTTLSIFRFIYLFLEQKTLSSDRVFYFLILYYSLFMNVYPYICSSQEDIDKLPNEHPMLLWLYVHEPLKIQPTSLDHIFCIGDDCDFNWILEIQNQCKKKQANFIFMNTGTHLIKNGKEYHIPKELGVQQAEKANIDYLPHEHLFQRLSKSKFRSQFHLKKIDKDYIEEKGMVTIGCHAQDFICERLAPAIIQNDGKQTPMKGHPIFIAQHATGCCCRGCLEKWHHIPKGKELTQVQQDYILSVLLDWIYEQLQDL